jgi:hypothetical protein
MNIKFYVTLEKNANDTCTMLPEAYGGEAKKMLSVFEWHKQFKEGRMRVKLVQCSEAYGGETMKMSRVLEWHKQFREGHENVEDVKITNEDNTHHFLQYQVFCSI